jgi:ABC-type Mn2+/Zn2+ transport system permease subunit
MGNTETAPTLSGARERTGTTGTHDLFSEATHRIARWVLPVVLGLVYGNWVAVNRRHGGPITESDLALGVWSALAFTAVCIAVIQLTRHLRRDMHALHALARAAFVGVALGFLYSQTGDGARSVVLTSLAVTVAVFLLLFYRFHTRNDA